MIADAPLEERDSLKKPIFGGKVCDFLLNSNDCGNTTYNISKQYTELYQHQQKEFSSLKVYRVIDRRSKTYDVTIEEKSSV